MSKVDLDLVASSDAQWRRCAVHEESRDPETKVCDGCAAEARPNCLHCHGSGTTIYWSGGLEWPERCRCRAPRDPWRPDRGEYAA